jgi:hypothetical protein
LNTNFELASRKELKEFVKFPSLYRHNPALLSRIGRNIYREPHFHFDENFFRLKDPVYLDGFWQSPLYFKDIESGIREDFTVRPELTKDVADQGKEMESRASVAVHIRRGDFLQAGGAAYHGVMSGLYYENAIRLIKERTPGAFVYFFSDDLDWVRKNIALDKSAVLVSSFTKSGIEDF